MKVKDILNIIDSSIENVIVIHPEYSYDYVYHGKYYDDNTPVSHVYSTFYRSDIESNVFDGFINAIYSKEEIENLNVTRICINSDDDIILYTNKDSYPCEKATDLSVYSLPC